MMRSLGHRVSARSGEANATATHTRQAVMPETEPSTALDTEAQLCFSGWQYSRHAHTGSARRVSTDHHTILLEQANLSFELALSCSLHLFSVLTLMCTVML